MLVTPNSTDSFAKREAGGKGYNLYILTQAGLPVPDWRVLGASYFKEFKKQNELDKNISEILQELQDNKISALMASQKIEKLIVDGTFSTEISEAIKTAFTSLNCPQVAIRSSGIDEDSGRHSFAGQLSSFLFVSLINEAYKFVKLCWASGFSERGLSYRIQNKISLQSKIEIAVVFQQMVSSEKSGVVFTCNPLNQDPNILMINAVYGLGEGLVSGLLDADTFSVSRGDSKILEFTIVEKPIQLIRNKDRSGLVECPVELHLQNSPTLNETDLVLLCNLAKKAEDIYRFPQDIEWGWADGKFYLLQARPVTTDVISREGTLQFFDNSNIIESYGGLTLPLTFTFAHYVYHQVYVQLCEILFVPAREIRNMDYFLRNMIAVIYGRVYYNLLNWYKLTSILPGFKYNRGFMETMMGTSEALMDEVADRIKPPGFQETFTSKIRRFFTGLKFLYFHFTAQKMVDDFLNYFHEIYGEYRTRNYAQMPSYEIMEVYRQLEARLLREWKAPIVNDYLCMVHFGILKKLTEKWLGNLGVSIQNDLLCGEGNLESAEPTRELMRMAQLANQNAELKLLLTGNSPENCLEALQQSNFVEFRNRVHKYIDSYGHRCMNEMKLEQKDLHQDPSFLFSCLQNYLRGAPIDPEAYEKRERDIRLGAEKKVNETLSGLKKYVYLWSLKHARKAVKNRENTRFCRTRIYGVVRSMFYGCGREFALRGIIDTAEDIFYITLQELLGAHEGVLPCQNLRALVETRKAEYAKYADIEPAPRFMTRGLVYWRNVHTVPEETVDNSDLPEGTLKGTGCCPGIIEGVVRVIKDPSDDMRLQGEILVTLRTDPGWIPLYPALSGLLVERGGLLSHSAIVAREMGLPTIVGIAGLTQKLKSGMRVRFNGQTGHIQILE